MKDYFDYRRILGEGNPLLRYPQLLEAAIDEFSMKKFEDASLNDILKAAQMSKGSLYHHFGDKFGLYLCMVDIIVQKKISFFSQYLQQKQHMGDFFGTLRQLFRATMDFMFVDERMHHLYNRVMELDNGQRTRIMQFFPYDFSQGFGPLISAARQAGQLDGRYGVDFMAKMLEILLMNVDKFLSAGESPEEVIVLADQIIDFMQHGIGAKEEANI